MLCVCVRWVRIFKRRNGNASNTDINLGVAGTDADANGAPASIARSSWLIIGHAGVLEREIIRSELVVSRKPGQ